MYVLWTKAKGTKRSRRNNVLLPRLRIAGGGSKECEKDGFRLNPRRDLRRLPPWRGQSTFKIQLPYA